MIENNRNNEQIYGRNDMIMLDPNNKIYGSLEIAAFNAFITYYPITVIENNYNTWMKATYKSIESV